MTRSFKNWKVKPVYNVNQIKIGCYKDNRQAHMHMFKVTGCWPAYNYNFQVTCPQMVNADSAGSAQFTMAIQQWFGSMDWNITLPFLMTSHLKFIVQWPSQTRTVFGKALLALPNLLQSHCQHLFPHMQEADSPCVLNLMTCRKQTHPVCWTSWPQLFRNLAATTADLSLPQRSVRSR